MVNFSHQGTGAFSHNWSVSASIPAYLGTTINKTSNHATENKSHQNSVYFVPRTSEIIIQFSGQMP